MGLAERLGMPKCSTCGNSYDPEDIQGSHPYRHPVNGPLANKDEELPKVSTPQFPSDPILRLILIDKGIISVTDLTEAEQNLKASGMVVSGAPNGEQNT